MERPLEIADWGRIEYGAAWARQKEWVEKRIRDEIPDTLVFCEHEPAITLGRGAQRGEKPLITNPNIPVFEIERGGLATYHGPGQIVAYPIFKLGRDSQGPQRNRGVLGLIRSMERWVLEYLQSIGLEASIIPEKTGVWIRNERKIASIGIAARHWVSYHGLALNFATGLEPWTWINPCGFEASVMTDLNEMRGQPHDYASVRDAMIAKLDSF